MVPSFLSPVSRYGADFAISMRGSAAELDQAAGASLPSWSPLVFGVILLGALVVTIMQARRYFKDNPGDRDTSDGRDEN